jgi:hypothetical protein
VAKFSFVDINQRRHIRDKEPNECPLCHYSIQPDEIHWTLASFKEDPRRSLEIVYQCPRPECNHLFITRYLRSDVDISTSASQMGLGAGLRKFILCESVPCTPNVPHLPQEIITISPSFPELYTQSIVAENYKLGQIAGPGFRKALEFLIKDYCISINKIAENEIKSSTLSTCINKYVDNPQVKVCAERAAWLGNDETHYVRKWTDKDISHLKELITLNWIHSSILTRKYSEDMPKDDRKVPI